jgi:pimeloyl-ACP methyl ester carboxylesterase
MPLTRNLQRAVLYEPGAGVGPHADDGDHVGAGTFARERRAEAEWAFGPDSYRSLIPTLLIVGSDSPSRSHQATEIARAALPNSRVSLLDGQARSAPFTAPRLVAEHITWFLGREAAPLGDRGPPELGDEMEPAVSRSRRSSPARRASSSSASRWP